MPTTFNSYTASKNEHKSRGIFPHHRISQLSTTPVSFIQNPPRPSLWVISNDFSFGLPFATPPIGDKRTSSVQHLRLSFGGTHRRTVTFSLPKYFVFPYFHYLISRPKSSSQSKKCDVCVTVHHWYNNINNQLDATIRIFINNPNQLNMFRAIISPILRSTRLCLQLAV